MYSDRESELLNELTAVCEANQVNIQVDPEAFSIQSPAAVDVEHDEEGNLVGIGVYDGHYAYYFTSISVHLRDRLLRLDIIAHNGKGDLECLRMWGIDVKDEQLVWDTELISHIIDSSRKVYGLKKLAVEDLQITYPSYEDIVGKRTKKQAKERRTLDKWPVEIVSKYNAMDCFATWQLAAKQQTQVLKFNTVSKEVEYFNELERPVSFILQKMENRGVCVDLAYLAELKDSLEAQKSPLEQEIKDQLGNINLNSPKQLLEALNEKDIYPSLKGKPSTDKRAFEPLRSNPTVSKLLQYSEIDTLLSSFCNSYLDRGEPIVRPFFNQCGTRTGRLSCSNPNLLQIPRRTENGKAVRRMFVARPGMEFGDCDFGQIEPRLLAHLSKDSNMLDMFNRGIDFHSYTAERLGIDRERAKILNLSVGYRASKFSVSQQLRRPHEEAQKQIDEWWGLFPELRRWQDQLIYAARRSGFITTLLGRRIRVDNLDHGNVWRREAAERQLINNIAQASAAEVMKMAMIKIDEAGTSPSFGLLVQVYDELLFESADMLFDMEIVKECMENAIKLDVPLTVDANTGKNWAEAH